MGNERSTPIFLDGFPKRLVFSRHCSTSVGSTIPTLFIMLVVHHTHTFFDPNRAPGRSQNKLPWPQRQARKQIAMARCEKKSQQFCCKTCLQVSCLDPSMGVPEILTVVCRFPNKHILSFIFHHMLKGYLNTIIFRHARVAT